MANDIDPASCFFRICRARFSLSLNEGRQTNSKNLQNSRFCSTFLRANREHMNIYQGITQGALNMTLKAEEI
ncbi:hypothetical protein CVS40_8726 [Lucilia cuprina]|nr:hypothetical protein CVS40_8726 [Lucilia cuprina]